MRKKHLPSILPIILLLTACAPTDSEPTAPDIAADTTTQASETDDIAQPETKTADTSQPEAKMKDVTRPEMGTNPPAPATNAQFHDYQKVYAQAVTASENEYVLYSLIFLDDDDTPELVAYDSYYLTYSIYTVKDDALFCLADALDTVELTYFERTGILCEFARWNGGGDEGGYGRSYYRIYHDCTLTDDDAPILNYVYNAVYDENDVYTGEGITEYFSMGEETDETSYEKLAESLGISDRDERACSENALGREEMLTFLSKPPAC